MKKISIVVPCYNEEEMVPLFYKEIYNLFDKQLSGYDLEVVFVNDGSKDDTLKKMRELSETDGRIRYVSFSRNFGKEAAMYAGLQHATGDYIAVMDVDLQDPPHMLIDMVNYIEKEGFDIVATRRVTRKGEPPIRSFFARMFYKIINRISDTEIVDGARDFRLMKKQVVEAILEVNEYNRFSKGIFSWVGFETKWLEYENVERVAGQTKWRFGKLFSYSLDGITAFSTAPLQVSSLLGMFFCILAFAFGIFVFVKTLIFGEPVAGFPTLMCVILLIGGIQLLMIGVLGQYMSKMYFETKKRPIYIVKETEKDKQ